MRCMSTPISSITAKRSSVVLMRVRMSAACFAINAWVSGVESATSGSVDCLRCGVTISATRGTATWECISSVRLFGLNSRPGLPCLRAAVLAYLFQTSAIAILSLVIVRDSGRSRDVCIVGFQSGLEHPEVLAEIYAVFFDRRGGGNDCDTAGVQDHDVVRDVE